MSRNDIGIIIIVQVRVYVELVVVEIHRRQHHHLLGIEKLVVRIAIVMERLQLLIQGRHDVIQQVWGVGMILLEEELLVVFIRQMLLQQQALILILILQWQTTTMPRELPPRWYRL